MAVDMGIAGRRRAARRLRAVPGLPALPGSLRRGPAVAGALVVVAVVVLLAVVALSGAGGYTSQDRASFVSGCLRNSGATRAQCGCMFARISSQLPHEAFVKAGATWSLRTSQAFTSAVVGCMGAPFPSSPS